MPGQSGRRVRAASGWSSGRRDGVTLLLNTCFARTWNRKFFLGTGSVEYIAEEADWEAK